MTKQRLGRAKVRSSSKLERTREAGEVRSAIAACEAFDLEDFISLALSLRQPLATHNVPSEVRASLIEDVMFRFAVFVDERIGSDIHESIISALSERSEQLAAPPEPIDSLVAEVEIAFVKGRKAELNVLRSHLTGLSSLLLVIEIALGVRDVTEIRSRIDTERRFRELIARKGGIRAVKFKPPRTSDKSSWQEVRLNGSPYGNFEQSLAGLIACIRVVSAQWA